MRRMGTYLCINIRKNKEKSLRKVKTYIKTLYKHQINSLKRLTLSKKKNEPKSNRKKKKKCSFT